MEVVDDLRVVEDVRMMRCDVRCSMNLSVETDRRERRIDLVVLRRLVQRSDDGGIDEKNRRGNNAGESTIVVEEEGTDRIAELKTDEKMKNIIHCY